MSKKNKKIFPKLAPFPNCVLNGAATTLISFGVFQMTQGSLFRGIILLACGVGMDFLKYWGRKNKYW